MNWKILEFFNKKGSIHIFQLNLKLSNFVCVHADSNQTMFLLINMI